MRTVNIHQAKTHLSWLINRAVQGEPFIIAKAGKPMVRVTAIEVQDELAIQRTGFLIGQIAVPDDFNQIGSDAPQLPPGDPE